MITSLTMTSSITQRCLQSENGVMQQVLGSAAKHPVLPDALTGIISQYLSPFPTFSDLSEREVLQNYVTTPYLDRALTLAKRTTFSPMDAEIVAYAMQFVKKHPGLRACEIGCADGANGIFLAYAGAQEVVFHTANPSEIRKEITKQPSEIQKKCTVVKDSWVNLLETKPSLRNGMGLILCRNTMHLLTQDQQSQFLSMIKEMLAEHGQAIFLTNSIYPHNELNEDDFLRTAFNILSCLVRDDKLRGHPTAICSSARSCEDSTIARGKQPEHYFYTKAKQIGKWTQIEENFKKIDPEFRKKISKTLKETNVKNQLQQIESGSISATSIFSRLYHVQSLEHLFVSNGFEVITTCIVDASGHLVRDFSKRFEQGQRIGIIVSKKCST